MRRTIRELDRILRGEATRPDALAAGEVAFHAGRLGLLLVLLAAVYGFFLGWHALFDRPEAAPLQVVAATLKVPALFALTGLVTFPSLYVFTALAGSKLTAGALVRMLLAAAGVMIAVLASLGPIVGFFAVCGSSYSFFSLLNVAFFTLAGMMGLTFLFHTLRRLVVMVLVKERAVEEAGIAIALTHVPVLPTEAARHVRRVFVCWMMLFGVVGAQMGWVLRPFIGDPNIPFTWFRPTQSNVFEALVSLLRQVLGIH